MAQDTATPRKIYFLGELGIFVQLWLGAVSTYLARNPSVQIEVLTYPDYGFILKRLFPDNIAKIHAYDGPPLFRNRFGIGLAGDYPAEVDDIVAEFEDPGELIRDAGVQQPLYLTKQPIPNENGMARNMRRLRAYPFWKMRPADSPFFPILPIPQPIRSRGGSNKRTDICLLPRFRGHKKSKDRNLDAEFWNTLIADHLVPTFSDRARFVLCGLDAERVQGLDPQADVIRPASMDDEIDHLNRAALLICPLSGYGQLASFCGADVMYVLNDTPIFQEQSHINSVEASNIFGRRVTHRRVSEILGDPRCVLDLITDRLPPADPATDKIFIEEMAQ